ncbi:HAD family hydrolase [Zhouia amylolytica]|uniref:HAD family hydrolase n=1 Tax=Zhouia amylolytica TaxID=376730 RepID=UPI0020CCC7DC|nr:HAD family hydrolase [Zhouia amylolytica]MCQ0111820.1 HAD family hydrolase [Zhouia amylolytica]
MDLSKVRLVVSDMDGTLLNSEGKVSDRFFQLYEELKKHNIHFAAASGRQYHSITDKLNKIANEITIIAENGGIAKQHDKELLVTHLPKEKIDYLVGLLRDLDGVYVVLCGKNKSYIETREVEFIDLFNEYYAAYEIVEDLTKVDSKDILKIAVFHYESSEAHIYPAVKHLEDEMQVKVSGQNWLDLSHPDANKGVALRFLQNQLGVTKEETMVFGDYNNDLEMMQEAYFSYAMDNAHPNIKQAARFRTTSNNEDGVVQILEQLIASRNQKL